MFPHPKKEDQQALLLTMLIEGTKYQSEEDKKFYKQVEGLIQNSFFLRCEEPFLQEERIRCRKQASQEHHIVENDTKKKKKNPLHLTSISDVVVKSHFSYRALSTSIFLKFHCPKYA